MRSCATGSHLDLGSMSRPLLDFFARSPMWRAVLITDQRRGCAEKARSRLGGRRLASHPRRHRDTDQQSLGAQQASYDLAPRLGAVTNEQPVTPLLELSRRGLDVVNVELQPCMRDGSVRRPFAGAEA